MHRDYGGRVFCTLSAGFTLGCLALGHTYTASLVMLFYENACDKLRAYRGILGEVIIFVTLSMMNTTAPLLFFVERDSHCHDVSATVVWVRVTGVRCHERVNNSEEVVVDSCWHARSMSTVRTTE
jgi:hypothetical protein